MGITNFEGFLLASILLNITPGNDTIYILSKSIGQGRRAGIMSVLGISTGSLLHTLLAVFGLSVIIAQSVVLYSLIKYVGAAYIVYVGVQMLRSKTSLMADDVEKTPVASYAKIYREGILTNVLNPKVALFFIAFIPQFVSPTAANPSLAFLTLGGVFILTGTIWCLVLATFAATLFSKLKANTAVATYINRLCGWALIALGIKVALAKR